MGRIGITGSQHIQFLPVSEQQGVAIRFDVWKGPNYTSC